MNYNSLHELLISHKTEIIQYIFEELRKLPPSPYRHFIVNTKEGHRRIEIWVELLTKAIGGQPHLFFEDQDRLGYARAAAGFHFEFVFHLYLVFLHFIQKIISKNYLLKQNDFNEQLISMSQIMIQGLATAANTWLSTQANQIQEKVEELTNLGLFTQKIIRHMKFDVIARLILKQFVVFFNVESCFLALADNAVINSIYSFPKNRRSTDVEDIMRKTIIEKKTIFKNEQMDEFYNIRASDLKRLVSSPIMAHNNCYGVAVLYNKKNGFRFTNKESILFRQILYIAAIALENAKIIQDLEGHRQQLHMLNMRMISIQEEERRSLASDIHDTLAQTLSGISYKIELCKMLYRRNSPQLMDELESLSKIIDGGIGQSKQIMTSLHPDLIEIGLIPAITKHLDIFKEETDLVIKFDHNKSFDVPAGIKFIIFRVLQELLTNIKKHADAKTVYIKLETKDNSVLFSIMDDGKGFDMSLGNPWKLNKNAFGLFSIKERIESHNGTLTISSQIGKGCKITVSLPLDEKDGKN